MHLFGSNKNDIRKKICVKLNKFVIFISRSDMGSRTPYTAE